MNLFEKARQSGLGAAHIADWLGEGGMVVDQATAQHRANTCITCGLNQPGSILVGAVAHAVRGQLGIKNKLKLRVEGEKKLKECQECGCQLKLLIWEPQDRVEKHLSESSRAALPGMCWKIKKQ
jgi:hypothetical protein